jgi:peptide/nickel transport system substrate-binding protein
VRDSHRYVPRKRWLRFAALGAGLALFAAACGGGGGGSGGGSGAQKGVPKDNGKPVEGGSITYGLEAETLGGFCTPSAQLAAGGIQVVQSMYDTLTVPNDKGEYVPYLAKSVTPNADFTQWTIVLRDGIQFHNGSPLNADAVKLNLDQFRRGTLFQFVLADVSDISVADPMTVRVTMSRPWVAFPSALWSTARMGMAAPEQLNDAASCPRNPIGTGPFKFQDWTPNDHLTVVKNPNYWQKDKSGNQLPYLDQITFRPQADVSQRVNGLTAGDLNMIHLTDGQQITRLRDQAKSGSIKMLETDRAAEISHTMLNAGKPPFDNLNARLAVAYASDRNALNLLINNDVSSTWDQPYAPETMGYQKDIGFPKKDPKKAEEFLNKYKQETGQSGLSFTLRSTADPAGQQLAAAIKSEVEKVPGISVELAPPTEQSQYINLAIGGDFEAMPWRNFPGGDPDTLYVWWKSQLPNAQGELTRNTVNFGRINDSTIDQQLDIGRTESDQAKRKAAYEAIGKEFATQAYNIWGWLTLWAFPAQTNLNGFTGPDLPGANAAGDGGSRGLPIASVEPVLGLWLSK